MSLQIQQEKIIPIYFTMYLEMLKKLIVLFIVIASVDSDAMTFQSEYKVYSAILDYCYQKYKYRYVLVSDSTNNKIFENLYLVDLNEVKLPPKSTNKWKMVLSNFDYNTLKNNSISDNFTSNVKVKLLAPTQKITNKLFEWPIIQKTNSNHVVTSGLINFSSVYISKDNALCGVALQEMESITHTFFFMEKKHDGKWKIVGKSIVSITAFD